MAPHVLALLAPLVLLLRPCRPAFAKGCFHQHATQPARKCHRGADGVQKAFEMGLGALFYPGHVVRIS